MTSPRAKASAARWMASLAFSSETGTVPIMRVMTFMTGTRSNPSQERNRTGRRKRMPTMTASM